MKRIRKTNENLIMILVLNKDKLVYNAEEEYGDKLLLKGEKLWGSLIKKYLVAADSAQGFIDGGYCKKDRHGVIQHTLNTKLRKDLFEKSDFPETLTWKTINFRY